MKKNLYKVTLNWYGEVHTLYTSSTTDLKALNNAISQLAKRLKVSRWRVKMYYIGGKDNYKIERR